MHKIRNELGYSNDFIKEYVYDTQNNIKKTLLPINEKYLELKAQRGIDFGTDFYQSNGLLIMRSSKLTDFSLAYDLTSYLLSVTSSTSINSHFMALQGSVTSGNLMLTDKIITIIKTKYRHEISLLNGTIVKGIYEKYPDGNQALLNRFNIDQSDVSPADIIAGLASGGHLEQLKKHDIKQWQQFIPGNILEDAIYAGREKIIDYYDLSMTEERFDAIIIISGHIDLLLDITTLSEKYKKIYYVI